MHWVPSIGMVVFLTTTAIAAPLTCEQFKERLPAQIHAGGDGVARPADYEVASKQAGNPNVRYAVSGIVGLNASFNCGAGDQFQNIDVEPVLDKALGDENVLRIDHAVAFASASLCVLETIGPGECRKIIRVMLKKATDDYSTVKRRGEGSPSADEVLNFPNGPQVTLTMAEGTISIRISARHSSSK